MKFLSSIIGFAFCVSVSSQRNFKWQEQECIISEGFYGVCTPLTYCPQVAIVFNVAERQSALKFIKNLHQSCGMRNINGDPVVCCTNVQGPSMQQPWNPSTIGSSEKASTGQPESTIVSILSTATQGTFLTSTAPDTRGTMTSVPIDLKRTFCIGVYPDAGTCLSIKDCLPFLSKLKKNPNDEPFKEFLRYSHEQCGSVGTNVCCPPTLNESIQIDPNITNFRPDHLLSPEEGCGYSPNPFKKVVGGETSKIGTWPWIALVGYNDDLSGSPFKCGGSLITDRHVITAAHCIRKDLSFVRLGEHDLSREDEAKHLDINVARTVKHPNYNKKNGHSDLAILYLDKKVVFSRSISPICLPLTKELQAKSYVNHMPFVAGWGKTMEGGKSAQVLQELQLPILDNALCKDRYGRKNRVLSENQFDSAVVCAGVLSGGKDSCQGDSGGPLMIPERFKNEFRFYLVGIVAYGIGCARPEVPGVYTSPQYFMDWIIEKVAVSR